MAPDTAADSVKLTGSPCEFNDIYEESKTPRGLDSLNSKLSLSYQEMLQFLGASFGSLAARS